MPQTIPVVSLEAYRNGSAADQADFVRVFGDALREFGFVSVTDHGVDRALIQRTYDVIARFFALPVETKKKCIVEGAMGNRGFVGFGEEHAKDRKVGDLKEFFHVGREIPSLGPGGKNAFPSEVPDFEATTRALFDQLDAAATVMLRGLAGVFGAPEDTFAKMSVGGNSILRLIHYPPLKERFIAGGVRAAEHEDINLITLLCESTQPGLEILTKSGKWLAIEAPPGHIVVDTGDMMQRITNGHLPAVTHRVVNPARDADDVVRYSIPFFVHPFPTCPLDVLPFCTSDADPPKWPPITAQAFLEERLRELGL